MRWLRDLAVIAGTVAIAWLSVCGLLAVLVPATAPIDTWDPEWSIYATDTHMVTYESYRLGATNKPKVIILGASSTREGLRPKELQEFFPEMEIHNMAIGPSNWRQVREIGHLIRANLSKDVSKKSVIIVGLNFFDFRSDEILFDGGPNRIEAELLKTKLFRKTGSSLSFALPDRLESAFLELCRPYFFAAYFANGLPERILRVLNSIRTYGRNFDRKLIFPRNAAPKGPEEAKSAPVKLSDAEIEKKRKEWAKGTENSKVIPAAQWSEFQSAVGELADLGARIYLTEVPIPSWHERHNVFYDDFRSKRMAMISELVARPNVKYIDLQGSVDDTDFYDSTHPSPNASVKWARALVSRVAPENSN